MGWAIGILAAGLLTPAMAAAKEVKVGVDAKTEPWNVRANPRFRFGVGDGRPPVLVKDATLRQGARITITAAGSTSYGRAGARSFDAEGDPDWNRNRGDRDLFPSYYMRQGRVYMNQLVGAFVSADGVIVGEPFGIGRGTEVVMPEGAAAISLGINDDQYFDNNGILTVRIVIPEPKVTVEEDKPAAGPTAGGGAATAAPGNAPGNAPAPAPAPVTTGGTETKLKQIVVSVDAAAAPWDVKANVDLVPLAAPGSKPPVVVPIEVPAGKIRILAEGTTDTPTAKGVGVDGEKKPANDTLAAGNQRYPSFYIPKLMYPVNKHALVAVFVDEKGVIVSRPFPIGAGIRTSIPAAAAGVALGFNDADFTGNTGALKVLVELPE